MVSFICSIVKLTACHGIAAASSINLIPDAKSVLFDALDDGGREIERKRESRIDGYIRRNVPFRSLPVLGITIGVTSGKPRGKTVKVAVRRERARFHPRRGI